MRNIITVDWEKHAGIWHYFGSAINAVKVGRFVGETFGDLLVNRMGVEPRNMHAFGHSLGAHFVGNLGRKLTEVDTLHRKMSRITG